jgi:hypothetical protein
MYQPGRVSHQRSTDRILELSIDFCNDAPHGLELLRDTEATQHGTQSGKAPAWNASSMLSPLPMPIMLDICDIMGPNRPDRPLSLARAFSSTAGKERKRRVWPVGAVSKTISEYFIELTCLVERLARPRGSTTKAHFMSSAKAKASSTPGIAKARSCIMLCIPVSAAFLVRRRTGQAKDRTRIHHFLNRSRRVDLHGVQVVVAIDLGRFLAKLLPVSVRQVVRGVRRASRLGSI